MFGFLPFPGLIFGTSVGYAVLNSQIYQGLHQQGHKVQPSFSLTGYAHQLNKPTSVTKSVISDSNYPTMQFNVKERGNWELKLLSRLKNPHVCLTMQN
jgi:hypothetical protein